MDPLEELFELRKPGRVVDYLEECPRLRNFLVKAHNQAMESFLPPVRFALEVYEWDTPLLFFIVVTGQQRKSADPQFEAFDTEYWVKASQRYYDLIGLDMEYGRIED